MSKIRDALKSEGSCREILRNYRKDGTPFWCELSISTVQKSEVTGWFILSVYRKTTLQVKAQQRIAQLEAQLAEVRAMGAKLTNG